MIAAVVVVCVIPSTTGNVDVSPHFFSETPAVAWLDGRDLVSARISVGMFGTSCLEVAGAACSVQR